MRDRFVGEVGRLTVSLPDRDKGVGGLGGRRNGGQVRC